MNVLKKFAEGKHQFPLGQILATPGALAALEEARQQLAFLLQRHQQGDFGDTCQKDSQMNADALEHGGRIFSVYRLKTGVTLWIITEADRASTTALLPQEY